MDLIKSSSEALKLLDMAAEKTRALIILHCNMQERATAATADYEKKLEEWTKKAKKARKLIISTISASVMTYVKGERNPAEMWKILEER